MGIPGSFDQLQKRTAAQIRGRIKVFEGDQELIARIRSWLAVSCERAECPSRADAAYS